MRIEVPRKRCALFAEGSGEVSMADDAMAELDRPTARLRDRHAGAGGQLRHLVRHAAEQQAADGPEAAPAHHDQVDRLGLRVFGDHARRIAELERRRDRPCADLAGTGLGTPQQFLSRLPHHLGLGQLDMLDASVVLEFLGHPSMRWVRLHVQECQRGIALRGDAACELAAKAKRSKLSCAMLVILRGDAGAVAPGCGVQIVS